MGKEESFIKLTPPYGESNDAVRLRGHFSDNAQNTIICVIISTVTVTLKRVNAAGRALNRAIRGQLQNNFRFGFRGVRVNGRERANVKFIGSRRAEYLFQFRIIGGVGVVRVGVAKAKRKGTGLERLGQGV